MSKDGVFVCGSPFADVPAVAWALGQHEALSAGPASGFLYPIFGRAAGLSEPFLYGAYKAAVSGGGWLSTNGLAYPDFLRYLGLGVDAMFSEFSRGRRWIDSSPENALFIDELAYMFPRATFIVPQEDPEYVLRVMLRKRSNLGVDEFQKALQISKDFRNAVIGVAQRRPDRVLVIEQASLVSDPDMHFSTMLEFVGENATAAPATFFSGQQLLCGMRPDALRAQRGAVKAAPALLALLREEKL